MNRSYKLVILTSFLTNSYNSLHSMDKALPTNAKQERAVPFTIPASDTMRETLSRRRVATLKENSLEAASLLAKLEADSDWQEKVKEEFINEHLVFLADVFKDQLKVHYLKYYESLGTRTLGLARSGAFIPNGGLIIVGFQGNTTVLDFWMLSDLLNEEVIDKRPRVSKMISFKGGVSLKTKIHTCQNSNRFILQTSKCLQIWNVHDDQNLILETTLDVETNDTGISLSPDGSHLFIIPPGYSPELLVSLNRLSEKLFPQQLISLSTLLEESARFSIRQFEAHWSPCGEHIATIQRFKQNGTIMLWQVTEGIPTLVQTSPEFSLAKPEHSFFALSPDKRFLVCILKKDRQSPQTSVYLVEIASGKSECLIAHIPDKDKANCELFRTIQYSIDGRYCLLSFSKDKPILYDLQHRKTVTLDTRVLEFCPGAKMDGMSLNNAHLSNDNHHIFSVNHGVPQVIELQQPSTSLSLRELILLAKLLSLQATSSDVQQGLLNELLASMNNRAETKPLAGAVTRYFEKG